MRGSTRVLLLAAAGLTALWQCAASAQEIDSTPCEQECYDQQSDCVTACGTQNNPVDCEGQCQDDLDDCLSQCN